MMNVWYPAIIQAFEAARADKLAPANEPVAKRFVA
jgi:hypothetical protein